MKIRPWSEEDIPGIRNVIWTTWLSAYSSFIPEKDLKVCFDEWYGEAALRNNLSDSLVEGSVAVEGENILASMRCRWSPEENRYFVGSLYVLPHAQNRGLGRLLMAHAAKSASVRHQDRVWLGVMVQNVPAFEWYTKLGYTVSERQPFRMGETTVEHYIGSIAVTNMAQTTLPKSTKPQKPNHD